MLKNTIKVLMGVCILGLVYASTQDVMLVPQSTILTGRVNLTSAGTAQAIGVSTSIKSILIKALSANTGVIYIGNSATSSSVGFPLDPGESISLDVDNLASIYIDGGTTNDDIAYIAAK